MDPKLYKAVRTSDIDSLQELARSDSTLLLQVTKQKDNMLHVAAKYALKEMTEKIIELSPLVSLVNQKNLEGDTPLHIAARLGSLETAQILIKCANSMSQEIEAGERLVRMVNTKKDTALHEAARNGHFPIAELLIKEDHELTRFTNIVGESPLFIAVDKKHIDIAKLILKFAPAFSYGGRNNMNVLHAAAVRSQDEVLRLSSYLVKFWSTMDFFINMSFKYFFKYYFLFVPAIAGALRRDSTYEDFFACLTEKCQSALPESDDYGWTPLHYAVQFGAEDICNLFLSYDYRIAYIRDKDGMSVIHIAAREGQVTILKMLASCFPEIWDLQDDKGQTALHIAVASGMLASVKFILGTVLSCDDL